MEQAVSHAQVTMRFPWGVNARGVVRGRHGVLAAAADQQSLLRVLRMKAQAGVISVTERRCLSALQHGGGS